jgi:hypothetical protein
MPVGSWSALEMRTARSRRWSACHRARACGRRGRAGVCGVIERELADGEVAQVVCGVIEREFANGEVAQVVCGVIERELADGEVAQVVCGVIERELAGR